MSIWVRDDGTITDEGDPTAFEYVPASHHNKLREALEKLFDEAQSEGFEWTGRHEVMNNARAALKATEDK